MHLSLSIYAPALHATDINNFSIRPQKAVQGSHLLNNVAAGTHFALTGAAKGGELRNKAGMCSGCYAAGC